MSKPFKPKAHPYDKAREELQAVGGGLFNITFNGPMQNGSTLGPWKGDEVTAYRFFPEVLFPLKHYKVHFTSKHSGNTLWFVNLKGDTTQEERNRLAEVFMDLINTQRS